MSRKRGEVVWQPAVFADYHRPFLVISTDDHPYHGEEFIALSITTSESSTAIPIEDGDWKLGELPDPSYVKPWNPLVLKEERVGPTAGALSRSAVDTAVDALVRICRD